MDNQSATEGDTRATEVHLTGMSLSKLSISVCVSPKYVNNYKNTAVATFFFVIMTIVRTTLTCGWRQIKQHSILSSGEESQL